MKPRWKRVAKRVGRRARWLACLMPLALPPGPSGEWQHTHMLLALVCAAAVGFLSASEWAVQRYGPVVRLGRVVVRNKHLPDRAPLHGTDLLTRLPTRSRLLRQLRDLLEAAAPKRQKTALLILDFKNFKAINDGLGHVAGDQVLRGVAKSLRNLVADHGVVARLGSDEFALALNVDDGVDNVQTFCGRVLLAMRQPVQVDHHTVYLHPSIGVALAPQDDEQAEPMLRKAYAALQFARRQHEACYLFYDPYLHCEAREHLDLRMDLGRALREGELRAYFQPTWDLRTGQLAGAEALVRWQHPQRGLLLPAAFLALAESDGLIVQLGYFMLDEVLQRLAAWLHLGFEPGPVSVNLSMTELRNPLLVETVRQKLCTFDVPADRLCFEITESSPMRGDAAIMTCLHGIRALGCGVLLDDFGTGYSSLDHLRHLPINALKIDQSYVGGITLDSSDRLITETIVRLAQGLDLKIVAEGVETEAQVSCLRGIDCDLAQGFLYGRPMPADDYAVLLRTQRIVTLPPIDAPDSTVSCSFIGDAEISVSLAKS